jgi:hypothetical protein
MTVERESGLTYGKPTPRAYDPMGDLPPSGVACFECPGYHSGGCCQNPAKTPPSSPTTTRPRRGSTRP